MKVVAGDWPENTQVTAGKKTLIFQPGTLSVDRIDIASDIASFDIVTEENRASLVGKLGWGAAGAVVFGPLGLLAGVLAGGNKKDRLMAFAFADGRKVLVKGNASDVQAITIGRFKGTASAAARMNATAPRPAPKRARRSNGAVVLLLLLLVAAGWFAYYVATHQQTVPPKSAATMHAAPAASKATPSKPRAATPVDTGM